MNFFFCLLLIILAQLLIQISTPHSLGILSISNPPSSGQFRRGYDQVIFTPILNFLNQMKIAIHGLPLPVLRILQHDFKLRVV